MLAQFLTHRNLLRYDEQLGHLYVPNLTMRIPYSEKPYFIRTNKQGFRSNINYDVQNPNDKPRILFLGDSYTAGDGVANEKRFTDIVAAEFGVDSYNFGLSGSGVDQQYLIYKNIANSYEHDLLVIAPHITDILRNLLDGRVAVDGYTGCKTAIPKPFFTLENENIVLHNVPVPIERELIFDNTGSTRFFEPSPELKRLFDTYVPQKVKARLLRLQWSKELDGYQSENNPKWLLMRRLIEEIIRLAGKKSILLVPLPYHLPGMNPDYRSHFIHLAEQYENVFFVDILEKFKLEKDAYKLYFKKDEHYSEYGHQVVAQAIIKSIQNLNLLKSQERSGVAKTETKTSTYVLGISAFYHDSAAALIKDGEIIAAAQEERFSRIKNDPAFPHKAINYCLEEAEINLEQVSSIAFYDHPYLTLERIIAAQAQVVPKGLEIWKEMFAKWASIKLHIPALIRSHLNYTGDVYIVDHHKSHAASAYFPSPFAKAAILTVDGVGEWATASISYAENNEIKILKEIHYPNSVGLLYSAFTYYTGFKVNEGEYKLMGLSPYGEPTYVELIKNKLVTIHDDGSITLNMEYFGFNEELCMINEKFESLFGAKARQKDERITKQVMDIAKSIQVVIEEIILKMAQHAKNLTGADYLCMAGGVALNCVANGKLLRSGIFKDLWIQPAAGDAGSALGCALELYYTKFATVEQKQAAKRSCSQKGSYWGPAYSRDEIKSYLDTYQYKYVELDPDNRSKIVAQYLADGKIVGHFSGRVEYGPRALGARSILGDPRDEKAQSILNLKIKFRESFRPFAPTVLAEEISTYFDIDRPSPYMQLIADVRKERWVETHPNQEDIIQTVNQKRSDLPAITHVDHSARIQSIATNNHPIYYDLISEFQKLTGYGVVINTSFNVNGEPIICTPRDAVNCFMNTDMDVLVVENFLLLKTDQPKINPHQAPARSNKSTTDAQTTQKIQAEAEKIYKKYFPDLKKYFPDFYQNQLKSQHGSTWVDFTAAKTLDHFPTLRQLNADEILQTWRVIPPAHRQAFLPLLQEVIRFSNKFKIKSEDIQDVVYDSIYVMF